MNFETTEQITNADLVFFNSTHEGLDERATHLLSEIKKQVIIVFVEDGGSAHTFNRLSCIFGDKMTRVYCLPITNKDRRSVESMKDFLDFHCDYRSREKEEVTITFPRKI
jgi:hypothetical protein